jgi:transposase
MDQVHVIRHKVRVEKLSLRQVAKDLGISRNTVRRYLRDETPIGERRRGRRRSGRRSPTGLTPCWPIRAAGTLASSG